MFMRLLCVTTTCDNNKRKNTIESTVISFITITGFKKIKFFPYYGECDAETCRKNAINVCNG
jgi:hypothetical protein